VNELELIERLSRNLPANDSLVVGAGDDCAVLDLGLGDRYVLFKTDAVVEGIHFTGETQPEKIGHKALARCLSDIAAMAGTPTAALITLALPPKFNAERVEAIYKGMSALAQRYSVAIAGGETTTNPERTLISVAVIGTVEKARCVRRSGAKAARPQRVRIDRGGGTTKPQRNYTTAAARTAAQKNASATNSRGRRISRGAGLAMGWLPAVLLSRASNTR